MSAFIDYNDFIIENNVLVEYIGPGGDVVIPEGVTEIHPSAFHRCKERFSLENKDHVALISVVIPEGVTRLKGGIFQDCHQCYRGILLLVYVSCSSSNCH